MAPQLRHVVISFSEGDPRITSRYTGVKLTTWDDADHALRGLARYAPRDDEGGYNKTDVIVTWDDGTEYQARIDLTFSYVGRSDIVRRHIREFCAVATGRLRPPHLRPPRCSDARYAQLLEMFAPGRADFERMLDIYLPEGV